MPLQAIAVDALDQLQPRESSPLLFPNARGGYVDFRNFNRRHWKPVQKGVGIEPLRDLYDLRHTYATFALRAGVPVFALSRFMGTSIAMIDLHYGHLAVDKPRARRLTPRRGDLLSPGRDAGIEVPAPPGSAQPRRRAG